MSWFSDPDINNVKILIAAWTLVGTSVLGLGLKGWALTYAARTRHHRTSQSVGQSVSQRTRAQIKKWKRSRRSRHAEQWRCMRVLHVAHLHACMPGIVLCSGTSRHSGHAGRCCADRESSSRLSLAQCEIQSQKSVKTHHSLSAELKCMVAFDICFESGTLSLAATVIGGRR